MYADLKSSFMFMVLA